MTHLRIKELAEAKGLNITTLARKALLSYSSAHALWHGRVAQYDRKTLDRVAIVLEVRVPDLFAGEPEWVEPGQWVPELMAA